MPDIAFRIQRLFSDDKADAAVLSNLIQTDPSLSAKLLRTANIALYRWSSAVNSLQQAIARMGIETLRKPVLVYAAECVIYRCSPDCQHFKN
jgi:HD-like signal output (HDOD) protein